MTNGNKLRKQLAGQLYEGANRQPSPFDDTDRAIRVANNPLYLASDVVVPEYYAAGNELSFQDSDREDMRIDIDPDNPDTSSLYRQPSGESISATSDPGTYHSAITSPPKVNFDSEISEVINMPTNRGRISTTYPITEDQDPIDVAHINVIGSPPPGYHKVDEPPLKRFLREANRIWVAPMLAGLPAWLDNWW